MSSCAALLHGLGTWDLHGERAGEGRQKLCRANGASCLPKELWLLPKGDGNVQIRKVKETKSS